MAVTPTDEQIRQLVADSATMTGEVVMLNLLKFRATSAAGDSGEESYQRYGDQVVGMVEAQGGHVVWMGRPDQVLIGDPDRDRWDAVALVSYPSRSRFIEMVTSPEYQEAHEHREGGLERSVLLPMTPGEAFASGQR